MAAMREEQKDIADLGPIGILREGVKVYRANARVFFLIQLTLMLPLVILALGLNYLVLSNLPVPPNLNRPLPGGKPYQPLWPLLDLLLWLFDPSLLQLDPLLVLLAASAFALVFRLALSLAQSTSLYSLGLHYAGRPIAYLDVVHVATPRLWMRMAVTNTWSTLMGFFLDLVRTLSASILTPAKFPCGFPLGQCLRFAISLVSDYRDIVFKIASGVSVLEEDYGWAAARKGMKLLNHSTLPVAGWFRTLLLVPKGLGVVVGSCVVTQMKKGDFSAWTGAQLLFITVVYLAWAIIAWQVEFLCLRVQYVSFKAHHNENLADPLFQKMNGGFVAIGDGSNTALLGGKQSGILHPGVDYGIQFVAHLKIFNSPFFLT